MKQNMQAFIDNYDEITFLVFKKGRYKAKHFYLYDSEDLVEELKEIYTTSEHNFIKIGLRVKTKLILCHNYLILDDMNNTIPVYSGSVVRTTLFDSEFYYDGPLGFSYSPESTVFRVWSPVAKSIFIELKYPDGRKERRELSYLAKGVWATEIMGDLDKTAYIYFVKIFEDYRRVQDPYGIASSANGEYNYIVDKNKLYKMKYPKPSFSGFYTDAVIYEASVRDLTCTLEDKNKGCFLGLVDDREDYGLNYIASLGTTHLQLMPVFDFGGVDDTNKDKSYNWGYNPEQYFVPSGWYTSNPDDPYARLNEMRMLIDEAHKRNLRVVMDVVYNHIYQIKMHAFDLLVPGYFFRVDGYGNNTDISGCGNDIATEKRMCSRYIIDNLKYWMKNFSISGFRFDLMGLLDIETLNKASEELKKLDPNIILYGEGWNMPNTIPDAFRPHSYNHHKMPDFAFFNDRFRDTIKGSQWESTGGYAFGHTGFNYDVFHLVSGSCIDYFRFQNPNQTINYVECHDNYTVYDYAVKCLHLSEEQAIRGCRLALQIVAVSLGVVFIHAGQEFYRTKKGVENSYNASDKINLFDYSRRNLFKEDIEGLKDLLRIRKEYNVFRLTNLFEVEKRIHLIDKLSNENLLCYILEGDGYLLTVAIKTNEEPTELNIQNSEMIFNGKRATKEAAASYVIRETGVYIFKEVKL